MSAWPRYPTLYEAYWDLEGELQQQGFDVCHEKRLYDRVEHDSAESVRLHLWLMRPTRTNSCASLRTMTSLVRWHLHRLLDIWARP